MNAQAIAVISVKANKCQTATSFSATRKPIGDGRSHQDVLCGRQNLLRSVRSATTPAIGLAIRKRRLEARSARPEAPKSRSNHRATNPG